MVLLTGKAIRHYSGGPSKVPICANRKYRHYSGNRHYSAYCHFWLSPSASTDTIAGIRHYLTGNIGGPLFSWYALWKWRSAPFDMGTMLVGRCGCPGWALHACHRLVLTLVNTQHVTSPAVLYNCKKNRTRVLICVICNGEGKL